MAYFRCMKGSLFRATLAIYANPNSTITASTTSAGQTIIYTATTDSSGNASMLILRAGSYTVTSNYDSGCTTTVSMTRSNRTYVADVKFYGYIDVYSTGWASLSASASGGSYSATCDGNGYARITVNVKGSYSITSTGTSRVAYASISSMNQTVTSVYYWQQWNSLLQYYQATQGHSIGGVGQYWNEKTIWNTGIDPAKYYIRSSGFTFDNNTGNFTLTTDGSYGVSGTQYNPYTGRGHFGYPFSSSATPTNIASKVFRCDSISHDEFGVGVLVASGDFKFKLSGYSAESETAYATEFYTYTGYVRGGTNYGNVAGTTLGSFPSNGRASDGYWYVET